jgi:SSS family solute:Na+ symporter
MAYGTIIAYQQKVPNVTTKLINGKPVVQNHGMRHFGSPLADFPFTSTKFYIAVTALLINIVVAVVLTLVLRALRAPARPDETEPADYYSDVPSEDVVLEAEREVSGAEQRSTT